MATEIERKFLVVGSSWKTSEGTLICQGYLNREPARTVRVRLAGDRAFLTIKGSSQGIARLEFEYPIPFGDAEALLHLCDGPVVRKRRHEVWHQGCKWEIDVFEGENQGLVVAEIELVSEEQMFDRPDWLGEEVSDDPRYYNSRLATHPFKSW